MPLCSITLAICLLSKIASCAFDLGFEDDSDLTSFVTRPEIKSPRFNVAAYYPNEVEPGYWFVAPYASLVQDSHARRYYQACQTGPAIYDQAGELVWSGACLFRNQNACDFKMVMTDGKQLLSLILYIYDKDRKGHGVVLDSSYSIQHEIYAPVAINIFNMHELGLLNDAKSAVHIVTKCDYVDVTDLPLKDRTGFDGRTMDAGYVASVGFREVDITTGQTSFEWRAAPHISLAESTVPVKNLAGPHPNCWNWFHPNSVEKNFDGDYMLSARYTDCIYKVSGKHGSVLWRLGGTKSDFRLEGFTFSRQHDARWLEYNDTHEIISFLDNGGDDYGNTSSYSSALIVELDKISMTARVLKRWIRPDHKLSRQRGNFQFLSNGNAFIGWSDSGYITEHSSDGRLLIEARFQSTRFITYRAFKFNFIGSPLEAPTLKAFVFGTAPLESITVYYASWNGATEVASWVFRRSDTSIIGQKLRTGFETTFQSSGCETSVYAEAVGTDGSILGKSITVDAEIPKEWQQYIAKEQLNKERRANNNKDEL